MYNYVQGTRQDFLNRLFLVTQKFVICLCMAREYAEADSVVQQMAALYYSSLPSYHPLIGEGAV